MEKRRLGRTDHYSTCAIMGTAALWESDPQHAHAALDLALQAGINHIDVAPQYGNAEARVGEWLPPHRQHFFLGCKTLFRDRNDAWKQLHTSLKKLHTEQLDLYQLHAVTTFAELDAAMSKGGAIEALQEARAQGLTRFLGITGHGWQAAAIQLQALQRFDFDTVMFPIYPALYANADYRRDAERLLAECAARDVGVQIIKSAAKQPWGERDKTHLTWYEPFAEQDNIDQGIRFALSQPGVTALPTAGDVRILPMVIDAVNRFSPMNAEEQEKLIAQCAQWQPIFV